MGDEVWVNERTCEFGWFRAHAMASVCRLSKTESAGRAAEWD